MFKWLARLFEKKPYPFPLLTDEFMAETWGGDPVTAIVGSAIIGGVASNRAANTQANAANRATDTQMQMFQQQRSDLSPFRQAGSSALNQIMGGFGIEDPTNAGNSMTGGVGSGYFNHQFDANDLTNGLSPNFDFMRKIGSGGVSNMANAMGGLGGNSLAEISKWNTGFAQNAYQQAFENYQNQRAGIYGRLQGIANLGEAASANSATGGSTYAGNIAGSQMGAGNAQAAGMVGMGNAASQGLGWYALNQMYNPGQAGGQAGVSGGNAQGLIAPPVTWGSGGS